MENLAPSLILLWDIKRSLERGQSISVGMKSFLSRKKENVFMDQVERWWHSQMNADSQFDKRQLSLTRKYLLEILEQGLKGQAILENLKSYESELILSCEEEIQTHIAKLPLILLIPLMGMIFPALMLLLIGPLMKALQF
ncbi:MAG: hypothetical protein H7061_12855 [Bdellovibrionaceae bacterium]|nr:hypothetical protein [Bdellovibrio sp.]